MNYKGKVIDTAVAPLTSTGKDCEDAIHFAFTPDDNVTTMYDFFKNENEKDDSETSD